MKTRQQTSTAKTIKIATSDAIAALVLGAAIVVGLTIAGLSALLATF